MIAAMANTHYPQRIEREYFDPELLDLYWRMVAERQLMYVRRAHLGLPRPWTYDPVLNSEFITNMYRELDPGTQYLVDNILSIPDLGDRLFNVLLYRLMGSQATTHASIVAAHGGALTVANYDPEAFATAVGTIEKGKLFGDAYRVAGYDSYGGGSKAQNIAVMFKELTFRMADVTASVAAATTAREGYEAIKGIPGFGEFLAHQIMVDLLYHSVSGEALLPFGENQWVVAGPGARNGIWALLLPDIRPRSLIIVMEWLRDHQEEEFAKLEKPFPYLANVDGSPRFLSLCNIQSTLCEFFKYVRMWDGTSRAVRPYRPSHDEPLVQHPLFNGYPMAEAADLTPLTPPPPVGGRTGKVLLLPTVPEAENVSSADGPLSPVNEDFLAPVDEVAQPASTFLEAIAPDGRTVQITINIYLSSQPSG
jgi:hypothetical protein